MLQFVEAELEIATGSGRADVLLYIVITTLECLLTLRHAYEQKMLSVANKYNRQSTQRNLEAKARSHSSSFCKQVRFFPAVATQAFVHI
jgi:hypothetical protein